MSGQTDLSRLLASLEPELLAGEFVFATMPEETVSKSLALRPIGMFLEAEGATLILPKHAIDGSGILTGIWSSRARRKRDV